MLSVLTLLVKFSLHKCTLKGGFLNCYKYCCCSFTEYYRYNVEIVNPVSANDSFGDQRHFWTTLNIRKRAHGSRMRSKLKCVHVCGKVG